MKRPFSERKLPFRREDLLEVTEELKNPARGWYRMYTFSVEQEPKLGEVEWCLASEDTLALLFIDIGSFRDRDLDEGAKDRICSILEYFVQKGYDCILRISYDHEGKALEREPLFFGQVLNHLRQVGEIVRKYAPFVFIFQGMLLGNWGEMHSSRFLTEDRMQQLADIFREDAWKEVYLSVRRPCYWRMFHSEGRAELSGYGIGMGLFDDGMFASESHLGTFGIDKRNAVSWSSPWRRADELEFEGEIGCLAPAGGEVVYGEGYTEKLTAEQYVTNLYQMQITYLNRDYDQKVLEIWKKQCCKERGVWKKRSVYDYIGAHLGYRLLVRDVRFLRGKDKQHLIEVEIKNVGFGSFYQEADVYVEYIDKTGMPHRVKTLSGLKGLQSDEVRKFSCMVEPGVGKVFLSARRKEDGRRILFANRADECGRVLLGYMGEG